MRFLLSSLIVFIFSVSQAQNLSDIAIYTAIVDSIVKRINFSFYYENLYHHETQEYAANPFDTFSIFDPNTYEDVVKKGIDFKIYFDSINYSEARLFKQRDIYPDGLYLISAIDPKAVHRNLDLSTHITLPNYPRISGVKSFPNSIYSLNSLGIYRIKKSTKENRLKYKYIIKAFFQFSGVVWDKTRHFALVECGFHYNIPEHRSDRGQSGHGFQALIENKDGKLEIIKIIGLWEE